MSRYRGPDPEPEFVRVACADDVLPGGMRLVEVDGRELALVNLDGALYAFDNNCPHNGGPLARGQLDCERGRVICPWHAWAWDVRTGRALDPPVNFRVPTYAVRVEGNDVLVSRRPG